METIVSHSPFVMLLAKYRMTFYWGTIDKKWWLHGQVENGCLQNSVPEPAENFKSAQAEAMKYIQRKYKLSQ